MSLSRSLVLLAVGGLAAGGCCTIVVEPEVVASSPTSTARPALDFDLHAMDPRRAMRYFPDNREELDGEDLAAATATLREAFAATGAFASVERARPGQRLHCEVRMRSYGELHMGGMLLGLTLGLVPDLGTDDFEIAAKVSAPGRAPRTYAARGHGRTWLWLPLLPIGLVQAVAQRGTMQQTVDALVAQMLDDGWLDG